MDLLLQAMLQAGLPAAPARVLLVAGTAAGRQPATLAAWLQRQGYTVQQCPPAALLALADPAATAPQARHEALLVLQVGAELDPVEALVAAHTVLAPQARLLWLDHFSSLRRPEDPLNLLHLPSLLALAGRQGWAGRVLGAALPGGRGPGAAAAALQGLALQRAQWHDTVIARIDPQRPARAAAMRALFLEVFGHQMDEAHWHWKYTPGRGRGLGLWKGGRLLGHFGALTRAAWREGAPCSACQLCDVMMSPAANAGLGRQSPFYKLGASLLELEIGWGLPHDVGFGFPSSRHMRIADRGGLYAPADAMCVLAWPAIDPGSPGQAPQGQVETLDLAGTAAGSPLAREIDLLWQQMAAGFAASAIGIRSLDWWRYRFAQRPGVDYRVLLWRPAPGAPAAGLLVLREREDHLELSDLLGPLQRLPQLVRLARQQAALAGQAQLQAWVSRSHRHVLCEPGDEHTEHPLDVTVPANAHTPGVPPEALRERWFLMGGDSDFR